MAKYRNLTQDELLSFEQEFVKFLVVNGIVAEDWEKMKIENPEKAEKIVDLFSDVILEGVLRKIQFIEIRQKNYVQTIQCLADKMIMFAMSCRDKSYDMRAFIDTASSGLNVALFELHHGEKSYDFDRELVVFDYVQKGFEVSDGNLFRTLALALAQ